MFLKLKPAKIGGFLHFMWRFSRERGLWRTQYAYDLPLTTSTSKSIRLLFFVGESRLLLRRTNATQITKTKRAFPNGEALNSYMFKAGRRGSEAATR